MVITTVFILVFHYIPQYGQTHILFYIGVCSLVGSLSVRGLFWLLVLLLFFSYHSPFLLTSLESSSFDWYGLTGNECQSTWNCFEANIIWNESANISANMGLHCGGFCLYNYPDELSKQGISFSFLSSFHCILFPSLLYQHNLRIKLAFRLMFY